MKRIDISKYQDVRIPILKPRFVLVPATQHYRERIMQEREQAQKYLDIDYYDELDEQTALAHGQG